jgi:hypothetical protein
MKICYADNNGLSVWTRKGEEMVTKRQFFINTWILLVLTLSFLFAACASVPYVSVNYRIPAGASPSKGQTVALVTVDERKTKEVIGSGARQDYKNYSGDISYSLTKGTGSSFKIGVFDAPALLGEAMKAKLKNEGVLVVSDPGESDMLLELGLKEFSLDLVKREWQFQMSYEGRLIREGRTLSKQEISGKAERAKIFQRREADKVVEELFTDLVNRFDLERLFQKAGL